MLRSISRRHAPILRCTGSGNIHATLSGSFCRSWYTSEFCMGSLARKRATKRAATQPDAMHSAKAMKS